MCAYPTLKFQTRYPKHAYSFIWPSFINFTISLHSDQNKKVLNNIGPDLGSELFDTLMLLLKENLLNQTYM